VARRRPQTRGNHYEKRRSGQAGAPAPATSTGAGLSSVDARRLAERIAASQQRYRIVALRLLQSRACGVVVIDTHTGVEHVLEQADQWNQLRAS
jgi:hypothetical protein